MSRVKELNKASRMDELNRMVFAAEEFNTSVYDMRQVIKPDEYTSAVWDGENEAIIALLCNLERALALVLESNSDEIPDLPKAHKQLFEIISNIKKVANQFHELRLMHS